jgi:Asp-tRNA(Asn)/Glu-tRNA(Gln) amidotransferase A subunit family amidase
MSYHDELDLLDQAQNDLTAEADGMQLEGVDRRHFIFTSLVATAASTFGFGAKALAQTPPAGGAGRAGGAGQGQAAPPVPLGNGEPVSWTFQPYPYGTGALMEKLIHERGAAAFARDVFTVEKWAGTVPTTAEDIAFLPAHRLSALLKERRITSTDLTKIYLDRIKKYDPTLLCAVTIMEEQAMAEAAKADAEIKAGKYRGPLHGIPYGVKDLFSTKGVRTTWGAGDFENRIIDEDAEIVVRLRDAGAVLIAKLATGLFAQGDQWYRGRTNNPWDIRRGSSGSSAGPSSATAGGCVAFGIGTETSGSIVSPARECGLSALRPTYGRVSRHGGMVLAWSQDRVGPICRTVEDCAMVFNVLHGVDPKDPSTVMTPFHFDRDIRLAALRIGVDTNAPKEFVDKLRELGADPKPIAPRPQLQGGALGVESAAAFDSYVQAKAKELGIDLATIPEPPPNRGPGGGGGGASAGGAGTSAGGTPGGPPPNPGNPTGMAAVTRWTNGRFPRAFEFVQQQRRRYILITQMAGLLKDFDMYVPGGGNGQGQWDIGLHAQTGHPCAVVPYKFEPQTTRPFTGGRPDTTASPVAYNAQPICAVLAGNLYNDDLILSVANKYQLATDWHTRHPKL